MKIQESIARYIEKTGQTSTIYRKNGADVARPEGGFV